MKTGRRGASGNAVAGGRIADPVRLDRPLAGAICIVGASLMFALMGAAIKTMAGDLPNAVVVFFRNGLALAIFAPWLITAGHRDSMRTRHPGRHLVRGLAGLGQMYLFYFTLTRLPLAEAVLLSFTSPLFIPLVARLWIGEPVTARIRWGVGVGFIGVLFILKPGLSVFRPAALAGLSAGILVAVAQVAIRRMSDTEPPSRIVFYFTLLATVISAAPLPWAWQAPSAGQMRILWFIAALAVAGQVMLTSGYRLAPAGKIGTLIYANVVFSALLGWGLWNESLDLLTLIGALIVCVAGILTGGSRSLRSMMGGFGAGVHLFQRSGRGRP